MGQTLSSPATTKSTEYGFNNKFVYASSGMQGWRISMEDSHTARLSLDPENENADTDAFFAVYDGHGGANVAKYAGQHLWQRLGKDEAYKNGDYAAALKNAFLGTDQDMRSHPEFTRESSGCTAVSTLLTRDGRVFCANAGDSRAVISRTGVATDMSIDHKPRLESERKRIAEAGGYVEYGRVNGNLALSRALGDFDYKKNKKLGPEAQIITCDPEIMEFTLTEDDEFVVIACDGIWDCLSSQQVVDFVRASVAQGKDLAQICEDMCEHCLSPATDNGEGIGADNMTVLIIALLNGKTPKEWSSWITRRVEKGYGYKTPLEYPRLYPESKLQEGKRRRQLFSEREKAYLKAKSTSESGEESGLGSGLLRQRPEQDTILEFTQRNFPSWDLASHGTLPKDKSIKYERGSQSEHDLKTMMFENPRFTELDGSTSTDGVNDQHHAADGADIVPEDEDVLEDDGNSDWSDDGEQYGTVGGGTKSLKEQLEEFEKEEDGRRTPTSWSSPHQGEAPPPPPSNDDSHPEQLSPQLLGDKPHPAVVAEGLLDSSESPLKV